MKKNLAFLIVMAGLCFCVSQSFAQARRYFSFQPPQPPMSDNGYIIHKTKYDFTNFAKKITEGTNGNYEKIKAIYQWICENIDYDTSYNIYDADQCIEKRRGVCNAYCELFYHLAKAVDVQVDIIRGKSKDHNGVIGKRGHAWLYAYTDSKHGILLDPTWGAGSTINGKFVRNKNCWLWFNVTPEWMILSHYPDDESYQFLSKPVSRKEFRLMPRVNALWLDLGLDSRELYQMARTQNLALPQVFSGCEGNIELIDFPHSKTLRIGQFYNFRIKMKSGRVFSIWNNKNFSRAAAWKNEGDNVYSIAFMPKEPGEVAISLQVEGRNSWNNVVKYDIEQPTETDWKNLEKYYPLSLPEVKDVKNLNEENWRNVGVNGHQLLKYIREGGIKELPFIYSHIEERFSIISFPMNKHLSAGQSYTFHFRPLHGENWFLINNNQWYKEWQRLSDGTLSMTITPTAGPLSLVVEMEKGDNTEYFPCMKYEVQ